MADNFCLIAITPAEPFEGEAERIAQLLDSGVVDYVHIRHKDHPDEAQRLLAQLSAQYPSRVFMHGQPRTVSCHSRAEAQSRHSHARYCLLSPFFDSISKPGYAANADLFDTSAPLPSNCIALGGVTWSHLPLLRKHHLAGAAMIGAVPWQTYAPTTRTPQGLYFITDGLTVEQTVGQALDAMAAGAHWVQIRMKQATDAEIINTAKAIAPMRHATGARVIIDDNVCLAANMAEVDGVHIGLNDMAPQMARRILGPDKILGMTANTADDIIAAIAAEPTIDYFGVGPYRFTTTKKRLAPTLGLDGYKNIMAALAERHIQQPIVAIGGIKAPDIPPLLDTGVASIAISGAIAHAEPLSPFAATQQLLTIF